MTFSPSVATPPLNSSFAENENPRLFRGGNRAQIAALKYHGIKMSRAKYLFRNGRKIAISSLRKLTIYTKCHTRIDLN